MLQQLADRDPPLGAGPQRGEIPRRAIVEPEHASLIDLSDEGDADVVTDINEAGIVVGTRTVVDGEVSEDTGGFYTAGGDFVPFTAITSAEDQEAFGFDAPKAINDGAWVVGNHGESSWLLRPPAEEEPTTTSTTAAPEETTTTVAPEETTTTVPEVTTTTVPEVTTTTVPEVTTTTVPEIIPGV